jgi:hypothetical protein
MPIQDPLEKQDEALQRSLAGVGYRRRARGESGPELPDKL